MHYHKDRLRVACRVLLLAFFFCLTLSFVTCIHSCWAQSPDPGGSSTGNASNVVDAAGNSFVPPTSDTAATATFNAQAKSEPLAMRLANALGQDRIAINFVWTLVCGYIVMFMQAGFALVETGFCRTKNAAHVMMTNFMIYPLGMLGFWVAGFAFMFGSMGDPSMGGIGGPPSLGGVPAVNNSDFFGLIGTQGFFLTGKFYDVSVFTLFLFQMVFMDTTATIPTGAMAERWKFSAFMVFGIFVSVIDYPIYGHWVWGGGWLALMGKNWGFGHGAVDFAGSGVVHSIGGFTALAGAMVLGPRIGKYINGKPQPMPGHNIPMALLGTFILAFGWFGFNPGSTLGASGGGNLRISVIAVNTMLASASGAVFTILYWWARYGKPDPGMSANGMLAGLVAITAPCAFVNSVSAVVIGMIAGFLICVSVVNIEKWQIDDPVGAISVHGTCGIWGVMSVGIFADGTYGTGWNLVGPTSYMGVSGRGVTGCLYGDWSQLLAQTVDSFVAMIWAFGISFAFFKLQDAIMGIRSSREDELQGLDLPEMGAYAYPDLTALEERSPVPGR